jgi:hypothetical protein
MNIEGLSQVVVVSAVTCAIFTPRNSERADPNPLGLDVTCIGGCMNLAMATTEFLDQ